MKAWRLNQWKSDPVPADFALSDGAVALDEDRLLLLLPLERLTGRRLRREVRRVDSSGS